MTEKGHHDKEEGCRGRAGAAHGQEDRETGPVWGRPARWAVVAELPELQSTWDDGLNKVMDSKTPLLASHGAGGRPSPPWRLRGVTHPQAFHVRTQNQLHPGQGYSLQRTLKGDGNAGEVLFGGQV